MRRPAQNIEVFKERRQKLSQLIKGAALILPAHPEGVRNNDVHHPYRQDSNLFYLTGFEEPGSVLIFRPGQNPETVMFVREKNPQMETWDGFRYGPEGTKEHFAIDKTFEINDFEKEAPELLKDVDIVYYSLFHNHSFDRRLRKVVESIKSLHGRSGRGNLAIKDSYPLLGEMRIRKDPSEISTLKKACQISAEAHLEVMRATRPGQNERALHGLFIKSIMERGAAREGYNGIFASGNSATTLHYVFNDQPLVSGDMLLVDAGAEFDYYTGDITRTYPVNGKFTSAQKRVYEKVLEIQKSLIESVAPGGSLKKLQEQTIAMLVDLMIDEKLLKGSAQKIIETQEYKKFYPHGVGHWLGSDVHDAGAYEVNGEPRFWESGMCFTIEPGLYIPANAEKVPEELKGLGIRIEDNILVTPEGHENLTSAAPKEVEDLESLVAQD